MYSILVYAFSCIEPSLFFNQTITISIFINMIYDTKKY